MVRAVATATSIQRVAINVCQTGVYAIDGIGPAKVFVTRHKLVRRQAQTYDAAILRRCHSGDSGLRAGTLSNEA